MNLFFLYFTRLYTIFQPSKLYFTIKQFLRDSKREFFPFFQSNLPPTALRSERAFPQSLVRNMPKGHLPGCGAGEVQGKKDVAER